VFLDAHRSWRHVKVTDQRTARDFATCMRDLADIHYPDADQIRVVLDNLSGHTAGALYETFPAQEAHCILQRLEFHYTPKHASWLNMVEIEIGVLRRAWIGASLIANCFMPKSKLGRGSAMRPAHASRGSSRPRRRATSWPEPVPTPPKSHNHCDEVLSHLSSFPGPGHMRPSELGSATFELETVAEFVPADFPQSALSRCACLPCQTFAGLLPPSSVGPRR
jgi:DDE superfamily endonuclease